MGFSARTYHIGGGFPANIWLLDALLTLALKHTRASSRDFLAGRFIEHPPLDLGFDRQQGPGMVLIGKLRFWS